MVAELTSPGISLQELAVQDLKPRLRGELLFPGDEAYDEARVIWNGAFKRRPAMIVRAADEFDVIAAVQFARAQDLPLAVRSGGHSMIGHSSVEGGLVVDLTGMKSLRIDPVRRVARAQPGLTWGEYAEQAHAYGLATTSGDVATVGIGGLTLGGGIGWMVRKYGLTIDHLLAVELVTADGRLVRASADEHPELFWALRGGGGNFGIATAFEFRLEPAGTVLGGAVLYSADQGAAIVRKVVDYAAEAPDELTVMIFIMPAPPAPFIPAERVGELSIAVALVYVGDLEEGERVVAPLRSLGEPIADVVGPMPYHGIFALAEEASIKGMHHDVRSMFTQTLDDETIEAIVEHARRGTIAYPRAQIRILGGAMSRVPASATAFAHRDKQFMFSVFGAAATAAEREEYQPWFEEFWRAVQAKADGVYVNFLADEGEVRIRSAYKAETFERLAALKRRYDPENLFQRNQNIKPSA